MTTKNDFGKHKQKELQEIFSKRPFQIQEPEKAKIIFLGLDANWDKKISKKDFKEIKEYLEDGVAYWKKNKVHSPMLKDSYTGDGKIYHKKFMKLGFCAKQADKICFMELLNCCTYGRSSKNEKEFWKLLIHEENKEHLKRIERLFKKDKIICISGGVKKYLEKLNSKHGFKFNLKSDNIKEHYHFSYMYLSNKYIENLGKKLRKFIEK